MEEQKAAIQKEANELRSTLREVEKARLDARRELQELRRQVSILCLLDFLTYRKTLSQGDRQLSLMIYALWLHSNIENALMLTGIVDQCVLCDGKSMHWRSSAHHSHVPTNQNHLPLGPAMTLRNFC